jgi:hypothetical protein
MNRSAGVLVAVLSGVLAVGIIAGRDRQAPAQPAPAASGVSEPAAVNEDGREADREAIRETGEAFAAAFEKGDP